jgi:hypothetical protein
MGMNDKIRTDHKLVEVTIKKGGAKSKELDADESEELD